MTLIIAGIVLESIMPKPCCVSLKQISEAEINIAAICLPVSDFASWQFDCVHLKHNPDLEQTIRFPVNSFSTVLLKFFLEQKSLENIAFLPDKP